MILPRSHQLKGKEKGERCLKTSIVIIVIRRQLGLVLGFPKCVYVVYDSINKAKKGPHLSEVALTQVATQFSQISSSFEVG